jgi:hypothetical protein
MRLSTSRDRDDQRAVAVIRAPLDAGIMLIDKSRSVQIRGNKAPLDVSLAENRQELFGQFASNTTRADIPCLGVRRLSMPGAARHGTGFIALLGSANGELSAAILVIAGSQRECWALKLKFDAARLDAFFGRKPATIARTMRMLVSEAIAMLARDFVEVTLGGLPCQEIVHRTKHEAPHGSPALRPAAIVRRGLTQRYY